MLSKKTINTVLNNNYSSVTFDEETSIIKLTHKKSMLSLKKNIQNLFFYELKTYCKKYAKDNNFLNNIESNEDFRIWFKNFETEFKKG